MPLVVNCPPPPIRLESSTCLFEPLSIPRIVLSSGNSACIIADIGPCLFGRYPSSSSDILPSFSIFKSPTTLESGANCRSGIGSSPHQKSPRSSRIVMNWRRNHFSRRGGRDKPGYNDISSTVLFLPRRLLRRDFHRPIRKVRGDFERAAERFNVAAQIADIHVAAPLQLGDRRLADREFVGQFLLRDGARLTQFMQRQGRVQRRRLVGDTRLARSRQTLGQFIERPVSAHGIKPSRLSSPRWMS